MWRWNMQIAIWAGLVFVQNHPNRKIVCPEPKLKCTLTKAISQRRGCNLRICQKDRFLFPSQLTQGRNVTNENKAKGGKTLAFSRGSAPELRKVSSYHLWVKMWKDTFPTKELGWVFPVFPAPPSCLTNVVCDSGRGQICNGGQRFVTPVTECHLLVITVSLHKLQHCH